MYSDFSDDLSEFLEEQDYEDDLNRSSGSSFDDEFSIWGEADEPDENYLNDQSELIIDHNNNNNNDTSNQRVTSETFTETDPVDFHNSRNDDDGFEVVDVNMSNTDSTPNNRRRQHRNRGGISLFDYMTQTGTRQAPRRGRNFREAEMPADAEIIDLDDGEEDEFGIKSMPLSTEQMLNTERSSKLEFKQLRDFVCPICLASPEIIAATPCGHMYCSDCIFKALSSTTRSSEVKGECSICRRKVLYKKVTFLEFKLGNTPNV